MVSSSSFLLKKSIPWIAILVTFSVLSSFSGYGVFSITITSFILTLSTFFLSFPKQKTVLLEEPVHPEVLLSHGSNQQHQESLNLSNEQPIETISQEKTVQNEAGGDQIQGYMVRSQDLYSESESNDQSSSSEDSDIDWSYSNNTTVQSPECSDDSISDEESLIEIALPSGHYVGCQKDEDPKFFKQQKLPDFTSETLFHPQPSFMELLAEINDMNEEENLIEIDLSMGSIKYSRFEIQT